MYSQHYNAPDGCSICEEFIEINKNKLLLKSCIDCHKEYPYCFCGKICIKVIPGSMAKHNYEYLTCDENENKCNYLGVRCTVCRRLCSIKATKLGDKLFWYCNNSEPCHFYKQNFLYSLTNHIENCKEILTVNSVNVLCKLIFRYVNKLEFLDILKNLYNNGKLDNDLMGAIINYFKDEGESEIVNYIENEIMKYFSPSQYTPTTPTRPVRREDDNIERLENRLEELEDRNENKMKELEDELQKKIEELENKFQRRFVGFENKLKIQNDKKIEELENKLQIRFDENQNKFKEFENELKMRFDENRNDLDSKFTALFQKLNISINENSEVNNRNEFKDGIKLINENIKLLSDTIKNKLETVNSSINNLSKRTRPIDDDQDDDVSRGRGRGRGGRGRGRAVKK